MGGDYTRFTFDPARSYSGVREQQGRVRIDSDANEYEAILDRRWRAETFDILTADPLPPGDRPRQCIVPLTTPDAFAITGPVNALKIGAGRAYVDGIVAECRGAAPLAFESALGEVSGTTPLPFAAQPFYYSTPAFPAPTNAGTFLLYLDIWTREVTALEEAGLTDPALGGRDTTTRQQTAWQVKAQAVAAGTTCRDEPQAWTALTTPPTGRLTSDYASAAPQPGPCVIDPGGSYTGLENRLYRIEIHQSGTVGGNQPALFKWSRDNASLGARVTGIEVVTAGVSSRVSVDGIGRDEFQRFKVDEGIELLDDALEWSTRERNEGGRTGKIIDVDPANLKITVDRDLTAFQPIPGRNPRVRRWDVKPASGQDPFRQTKLPQGSTLIELEDGIGISFGPDPNGTLRAGDYWVFSARTATGEIERLQAAPPKGVHHHYAKLAFIVNGTIQDPDCRVSWPPLGGCCTAVVRAGDDIQKAIDELPPEGGCVCVKAGRHTITTPLRISRPNVALRGESAGATIRNSTGETVLTIGGANDVHVEMLVFEGTPNADGSDAAIIALQGSADATVEDCQLRSSAAGAVLQAVGIMASGCARPRFARNRISNALQGVLCVRGEDATVVDNRIRGPRDGDRGSLGVTGIELLGGVFGRNAIERNRIADFQRGILVGGNAGPTVVVGNDVVRDGAPLIDADERTRLEASAGGRLGPSVASVEGRVFAITARAEACLVADNAVVSTDPLHGGILDSGNGARIERNLVASTLGTDAVPKAVPIGIAVVPRPGTDDLDDCGVASNVITGLQAGIVVLGVDRRLGGMSVVGNRIDLEADFIDELVKDYRQKPFELFGWPSGLGKLAPLLCGITVTRWQGGQIEGNRVVRAGAGVLISTSIGTGIAHNEVFGGLLGIYADDSTAVRIDDNLIATSAFMGIAFGSSNGCTGRDNRVTSTHGPGIGSFMGNENEMAGNLIMGSGLGVLAYGEASPRISGNSVYGTRGTGILVALSESASCTGDEVVNCGWEGSSLSGDWDRTAGGGATRLVAAGIALAWCVGPNRVADCQVRSTGEPGTTDQTGFQGPRYELLAVLVEAIRVHGCELIGQARATVDPDSRPALIVAGKAPNYTHGLAMAGTSGGTAAGEASLDEPRSGESHADVTDNLVRGHAIPIVECLSLAGEVMFSSNRCVNLVALPERIGRRIARAVARSEASTAPDSPPETTPVPEPAPVVDVEGLMLEADRIGVERVLLERAAGERVFAGRRIWDREGVHIIIPVGPPSVVLNGSVVVVNGNRIRHRWVAPSLAITAARMTGVGNATTGGATIPQATIQVPTFASNNLVT